MNQVQEAMTKMATTSTSTTAITTTSTAATTLSQSQSTSAILVPVLLFGTLNREIADVMYELIHVQLMNRLQVLPMLHNDSVESTSSTKKDPGSIHVVDTTTQSSSTSTILSQLHDYLLKQYVTAVDLMELYNTRNTLSIHMIQPMSRQRKVYEFYQTYIVAATDEDTDATAAAVWKDADWVVGPSTEDRDDGVEVVAAENDTLLIPSSSSSSPLVTDHPIPTRETMQMVQNEITVLHDTLQQLRHQRDLLTKEVTTIQTLQQQHDDNTNNTMSMSTKQITDHITTTTIPIVQTLREQQQTSTHLQQQMTTIMMEQERDGGNTMNDIFDPMIDTNNNDIAITKQQQMTSIQERYQHDAVSLVSGRGTTNNKNELDTTVMHEHRNDTSRTMTNDENNTTNRMLSSILNNLLQK